MNIARKNIDEFKRFMLTLAEKSSDVIVPFFGKDELPVELKADQTPVTAADRLAEKTMRDLINKRYPSHGIIGEEFGSENENAEFVWVLDPIDGTLSFTHACPLFGTLIGLMHNGVPLLGMIHQPVLQQLLVGDNTTTTFNGSPVSMRPTATLAEATLLATDITHIDQYHSRPAFDLLVSQTKLFRTWGDCYGYLLLARGYADIMLDAIMNPWDILALIPIIQGANGIITTWQGESAVNGDSCIAANRFLHHRVIDLLNTPQSTQ